MTHSLFDDYEIGDFFDEVFHDDGTPRSHYLSLIERFESFSDENLSHRRQLGEDVFTTKGITFTVYGEGEGTERTWPMDLFPRIIPASEWEVIERGLAQRVTALNLFLDDIYVGEQAAINDGIVPR